MVVRKCRSCDAVWHAGAPDCAFCGKPGEDLSEPRTAVALLDRPGGTPEPPPPAGPLPAPPAPALAAAPRLPSASVPLVFGALGLAAAALIPAGLFVVVDRSAAVLGFLGTALLLPFGPLAWWTGARYVARCDALDYRPAFAALAGRGLGIAVTLLLAAEGAVLAFLRALQLLQS